jgi:AraC-like DNA-binding protein
MISSAGLAADRQTVIAHLLGAVPGLDREGAAGVLERAGSAGKGSLRQIAAHLRQHRDPLRTHGQDLPPGLIRLAWRLHADGHDLGHRAALRELREDHRRAEQPQPGRTDLRDLQGAGSPHPVRAVWPDRRPSRPPPGRADLRCLLRPGTLVGHTESMEYVARVPAPPLDQFIDDIYCLTGVPRHRRMNVPPMPSAHLFINLGGPARLWDSGPSVPPAVFTDGWFMGVWTRRFLFETPARVRLVGVHFKPWGMSPFAGMPATELRDRWVPVDAVWQRSSDRIRNQAGEAASATGALRVLEEELRSRLAVAPSRGLDLVRYAGRRLAASHGAVPVGALEDGTGVSGNHLAAQFKSHVGVTPKRVARIYRFARLILSVDALRPVDWPGLAQTAGYFDQAHFSREFKAFTGHTPTGYLALRRRFPAEPGFPPDMGPMPAD